MPKWGSLACPGGNLEVKKIATKKEESEEKCLMWFISNLEYFKSSFKGIFTISFK